MCLLKKLSEAVMMIKDYKLYMFIYECINARKACKTGLLNAISNIKWLVLTMLKYENRIKHNSDRPHIPNHSYGILLIGDCKSGKQMRYQI